MLPAYMLIVLTVHAKSLHAEIHYMQVFEQIVGHAKAGHAITGSCFWMTASNSYPDYDGMTVYFRPPAPEVEIQNLELQNKAGASSQEQCASDIARSPLDRLQAAVHGRVSSLLEHARQDNRSVVEVIEHNAKVMQDLNRQGKECKVM